jgi:hypothetical protein
VFYSNLITVEEICNCSQSGEGKDKSVFYPLLESQPLDQSNNSKQRRRDCCRHYSRRGSVRVVVDTTLFIELIIVPFMELNEIGSREREDEKQTHVVVFQSDLA